jgi:hypothetical protein
LRWLFRWSSTTGPRIQTRLRRTEARGLQNTGARGYTSFHSGCSSG